MSNVVQFPDPSQKAFDIATAKVKYNQAQEVKKDIARLEESPAVRGVLEFMLINGDKGFDLTDLINNRLGVKFNVTIEIQNG